VGEGWCFFVDALSYGAVITSLLLMRLTPRPRAAKATRVQSEMAEGFRYVARSVPIRSVLLLLSVVSLMGVPYMVLLPVIAREVLGGGPGTLGALTAASGLGAIGSALYLASRRSVLGLERVIAAAATTFGVGLVLFSRASVVWLALPLMLVTGAGMMLQTAASMTLVQTLVDEDKRGRVMSLVAMTYFGSLPLGSLLAGVLAGRIGAEGTILAGGVVVCAAAAVFFRALPELRRAEARA
jgi:predicted MFS family arabinose efflux permease